MEKMQMHEFLLSAAARLMFISGVVFASLYSIAIFMIILIEWDLKLIISMVVLLIRPVVQVKAGLLGVLYAEEPENAKKCIIWGTIGIILLFLEKIFMAVTIDGELGKLIIILFILGLVLYVLYLAGALKNKFQEKDV